MPAFYQSQNRKVLRICPDHLSKRRFPGSLIWLFDSAFPVLPFYRFQKDGLDFETKFEQKRTTQSEDIGVRISVSEDQMMTSSIRMAKIFSHNFKVLQKVLNTKFEQK